MLQGQIANIFHETINELQTHATFDGGCVFLVCGLQSLSAVLMSLSQCNVGQSSAEILTANPPFLLAMLAVLVFLEGRSMPQNHIKLADRQGEVFARVLCVFSIFPLF